MGILLKLLLLLLAVRLAWSVYRALTRGPAQRQARPRAPEKRVRSEDIVDAEFEDRPGQRSGDAKR